MKRYLPSLSALLLLAAVSAACSPVFREGSYVSITDESALIVYDAKTKTEHFVRRGSFRTDDPYFGFLVPTPSKPELGEVEDGVFASLEAVTAPRVEVHERIVYTSLLGPYATRTFDAVAGNAMPKSASPDVGFAVVGKQRVGNFDATILLASDSAKLKEWLEQHKYDARTAVMDWLDGYVKKGWYITAFQMVKAEEKSPGLESKAVRMSFKTDAPFYPYKEPTDMRDGKRGGRRSLRVFVVADHRVEGRIDDAKTSFPGTTPWSNPLTAEQAKTVKVTPDGKTVPLAEGSWLTVVDDVSFPRPGTGDLYFDKSADQSQKERPPIIHERTVEKTNPREIAVLGFMGIGLAVTAGVVLRQIGSRKAG